MVSPDVDEKGRPVPRREGPPVWQGVGVVIRVVFSWSAVLLSTTLHPAEPLRLLAKVLGQGAIHWQRQQVVAVEPDPRRRVAAAGPAGRRAGPEQVGILWR